MDASHNLFDEWGMINPQLAEQFANWLEQRGLRTPISQVVGFQQFTGLPATDVPTSENTSSASYTDLATVGPSLPSLGDGKYLLFFGFTLGAASPSFMSLSINGSGGSDATCAQGGGNSNLSTMRMLSVTLANGDNSVVAKYRAGGVSSTFLNRWLFALRYANVR